MEVKKLFSIGIEKGLMIILALSLIFHGVMVLSHVYDEMAMIFYSFFF